MALGDLACLRLLWNNGSSSFENGLGMQCISPFTNWRTLLAAEFLATVIPDWLPGLSNTIYLLEIKVQDVVPGTGADVILTPPGPPSGAINVPPAPLNAALVASWRSDGIGRNTRGRSYLSGMPRNEVFNGTQWENATVAWAEDLAITMFGQYGPTGFSDLARFVVISRGPHSAPLVPPVSFPLTHAQVTSNVHSMRKRLLS